MAARRLGDTHLSTLLAPGRLPAAMIDVLARVLDIAAQLAPLVRAHAAAIGFAWRARIALRHRGGGGALRLGSGTRSLDQRLKTHFLIERARHCRVRRNNRDQTAANSKK